MIRRVDLFSLVFQKNLKTPKKYFEIKGEEHKTGQPALQNIDIS